MKYKASLIFIVLGFLFLLNAIFGRYLVLPGYLASIEQGQSTIASVSRTVSGWKIARYLLWAYSFKLGIYFLILGATLRTQMTAKHKWLIAIAGFVYIGFAYMPLPEPTSLILGFAGGIMTVLMIVIFLRWSRRRG